MKKFFSILLLVLILVALVSRLMANFEAHNDAKLNRKEQTERNELDLISYKLCLNSHGRVRAYCCYTFA